MKSNRKHRFLFIPIGIRIGISCGYRAIRMRFSCSVGPTMRVIWMHRFMWWFYVLLYELLLIQFNLRRRVLWPSFESRNRAAERARGNDWCLMMMMILPQRSAAHQNWYHFIRITFFFLHRNRFGMEFECLQSIIGWAPRRLIWYVCVWPMENWKFDLPISWIWTM